jgi:hypothetical protein
VFLVTGNAVRLAWERLRAAAGVDGLRFHDLRHEAVARFLRRAFQSQRQPSPAGIVTCACSPATRTCDLRTWRRNSTDGRTINVGGGMTRRPYVWLHPKTAAGRWPGVPPLRAGRGPYGRVCRAHEGAPGS